jgi:FKBP-type peptidyl-prolyl cis-trans isomerase
MIKQLTIYSMLFLVTALAACKTDLSSEADKKIIENDNEIQSYITNTKLSMQKVASGLYYNIKPGGGSQKPKAGEEVGVYYKISRLDGLGIDSTLKSLQKPDYFPFGVGYKLFGIEEGLSLMNIGDKATLLLPSAIAFGATAYDILPAYSVIRVDIELLSSKNEDLQINDYIAKNKLKVSETTSTGLRFIPVSFAAGGGTALKTGQSVTVNYTGNLLREVRSVSEGKYVYSTKFDSGTYTLNLGSGGSIAGFEEGISKMKVGDKAIFVFPSSLGYKDRGAGSIPPNTPLQFEVEVTKAL